MRKLYMFYDPGIEGNIFVDGEGKFIGWLHERDAVYDTMRMDFIPKFFGGEIVELFGGDLLCEDPNDELEDNPFIDDDEIREWCTKNVVMIKEAIRSTEVELSKSTEEAEEVEEFAETEVVNHVDPVTEAMEKRLKKEASSKKEPKQSSKKTAKGKSKTKKVARKVAPKKTSRVSKVKRPVKKTPVKGPKPAKPSKKKKKKK